MKKIAFLSFDWDFEIMSHYYTGMTSYIEGNGDYQLFVFNGYGNLNKYDPEESTFDVFNLCNIEEYDGFIVQGNRRWPAEMRQELVDQINVLGKPVISVNYGLDGAYYVGTDNYDAYLNLVKRIIEDRQCTKVAYLNGLESSLEASLRKVAFYDACEEMEISDVRVYQGNWQMEEGARIARELLEDRDNLPEVIFCCNDHLAVGVQETLQKNGVNVPEDIMITGFDHREIGFRARPCITTVDRDYETIGRTVMETMDALLRGESVPSSVYSPVQFILRGSCGYDEESVSGELSNVYYHMESAMKNFYDKLILFQPEILSCSSINDIFQVCDKYYKYAGCRTMAFVLNEDYLNSSGNEDSISYGERSVLVRKYSLDANGNGEVERFDTIFETKEIYPGGIPEYALVNILIPLRSNENTIGYIVMEGISPALKYGFLTVILNFLGAALESAHQKELLKQMNFDLNELYVKDGLTDLFNRYGLEKFGRTRYNQIMDKNGFCRFVFVDIDNLKRINDVYGHKAGDQAIQDTAAIIQRVIDHDNSFAMRYGGDEFLMICEDNPQERIEQELSRFLEQNEREFKLTLSVGLYSVSQDEGLSMEESIQKADHEMYLIKKNKKRG